AGRRHDSIHAEIDRYLPVVIVAMWCNPGSWRKSRNLVFSKRVRTHLYSVRVADRQRRLVRVGERVLKKFHDVGFTGHRGWAGFHPRIDWGLLAQNRGGDQIVHGGHVLQLGAKGTYPFELSVGWGKAVFI